MKKQKLLILSFTNIAADARVKKQALQFADRFDVVTCGYGPQLRDDIEHIELSANEGSISRFVEPAFVRARAFGLAFRNDARANAAVRVLRGRKFDLAIANELETLRVATTAVGAKNVLLDLHEFYPGLRDDLAIWVKIRQPFQRWILANPAQKVGAVTTVSETIAERYKQEFGLTCGVVRNAAPYRRDLTPSPAAGPIRLVHSGVSAENRRPEVMMRAVAESSADITLDLYLTQQHTPFGQELARLAEELGDRITLHPPVPHAELVATLNQYDAGIHILPPTNTNNKLALPNKFFDFVQARLAMLIGPTRDMQKLLERYDLGAVAKGFELEDVVSMLDNLTVEDVQRWKNNAHVNAAELSAERQAEAWDLAIEKLSVGAI